MQEYFASCLANLEPLLDRELRGLGAKQCRPLNGGVAFFAEPEAMYRVCLWTRLASRISLVLDHVEATDTDTLYANAKEIPWETLIGVDNTFVVHASGTNDNLRNSHFTELRVKDAIMDRLVAKRGKRPSIKTANADVMVDVRIRWNKATISLDLTGGSLYLRPYLDSENAFKQSHEVAMAAGMLFDQRWNVNEPVCLIDPSCGQGHLLVEAAMMAADVAPSLARSHWGFYGWAGHDEELWSSVLEEADSRYEAGIKEAAKDGILLMGVAPYAKAIANAKDHAKRAGVSDIVNFSVVENENAGAFFTRLQQHLDNNSLNTRVMSLVSSQVEMLQGDSLELAVTCEVCRIIKASDYALLGGDAAIIRFGIEPRFRLQMGLGRVACEMVVFDKPPAELCRIVIPDSFGGAEHVVTVRDETSGQFADRLRKVAKERRKWAAVEGISCYRVYDADMPEYAAAIDIYEGAGGEEGQTFLHIAEYEAPATVEVSKAVRRFDDMVALAPIVLGIDPKHVFTKVRRRDKGGSQYARDNANFVAHTSEGGRIVEIDLNGYLDTGIFLDHRVTREMVGKMAKDTRFLNLFAYTGTATLHAAAGGAKETTTVDLSQTYLEWAERNMAMNGFTGEEHVYERGDVLRWIDQARSQRRKFDLIFVDPPTFSNSKSMGKKTWDVQRDHVDLLIGVTRLLAKGGVAVFSCNLRNFKPDYEELAQFGVELTDITAETIPHDFERNPKIHKCYLVKRVLAPKTNVIEIPQEVEEVEEVENTEVAASADSASTAEASGDTVAATADASAADGDSSAPAEEPSQDRKPRGDRGERRDSKPRRDGDRRDFKPRRDGDRKNFKSRRDGDRHGYKPRRDGNRDGFKRDGDKRDFKSRDKRGGFSRDGESRDFKPRGDRKDFKPRGDRDGYKPRRESDRAFKPRREGDRKDFKPRGDRDGFKRDGEKRDFKPRGDRKDFKPKGNRDGFKGGQNRGGNNGRSNNGRSNGGRGHRGQSGFKPRGN